MRGTVVVENLTKTYHTKQRKGLFKSVPRDVEALKGVSMDVKEGEIFGLLGPNGAGKTTMIKILSTLLLPSSGTARLNGYDVMTDDNAVRATVGCMLMGDRGLYWKLTGRENLMYFGALYHYSPADRKRRAQEIIDMLDLGDLADRSVETYSSGQKMKLAFGKALINDAPLLILDEPTNTLDVPSASELRAIVRQKNQQEGKTVIYTTHIMAEAETLCDRVAIIDYGELLAMGRVPDLKASLGREHITRIAGVIPSKAVEEVKKLPAVSQATLGSVDGMAELTVMSHNGTDTLARLIETLSHVGATIQKITPQDVTLEDVFIAKTGRTLAENTAVEIAAKK
ncbi:MAG: ABC transporter ATP-binding protein [Anaerolineae bacterium]|nr:MAG: ABC transporter ATP-binding protein [Anaerolineae bacterium]